MDKKTETVNAAYHTVTISNNELRSLLLDTVKAKYGDLGDVTSIEIVSASVSCRDRMNEKVEVSFCEGKL